MTRRYVIHNHLPALARDSLHGSAMKSGALVKIKSGKYAGQSGTVKYITFGEKPIAVEHEGRVDVFSSGELSVQGSNDAADLQRHSGDVLWIDIPPDKFDKVGAGTTLPFEGRTATVIEKREMNNTVLGKLFRAKVRLV